MHFFRISFIVLAFLLAVPVVAFFAYDLFYFQPYTDEIDELIAKAPPEDRNPPLLVTQLVHVSAPKGVDLQLSRIIFYHLTAPPARGRTTDSIARQLLWQKLFRLHFTEQQRMALYCSLVYSGKNDPGLSAASRRLFNKPLSKLSAPEAATVVALPWGPSYYERHPDALAKRRDLLLQRLNVGL
jgi:hypothetical protein